MKYIFIFIFSTCSLLGYTQTHSINDTLINLSDDCNVTNFYGNTYYNAYDSVSVDWRIIKSTMPNEWIFSNCFPNCYDAGVLSGSLEFPPNSEQYLNCHFYPNNTPGIGTVKMEITTNNQLVDTVTWIGVANSTSSIDEFIQNNTSNNNILIFDLSGKKLEKPLKNNINIIVDQNGITKKYFYINE